MSTLIFFNVPARSHMNPTFPVIKELVSRGETVIYYSSEEFRSIIEKTGAIFRSYGDALELKSPPSIAKLITPPLLHIYILFQAVPQLLESLLPEVQALKPDYIMYNSVAIWGKYIGQILQVPTISSTATMWFGWQTWLIEPSPYLNYLKEKRRAKNVVEDLNFIAKNLKKRYGIKEKFDLWNVMNNRGDMTLIHTSKQFQPFSAMFDDSFKFVGPSIYSRPDAPDFPFEHLTEDTIIYISLGTLYNNHIGFYRSCLEAFANKEWQVVMSIGEMVCVEALGQVPSNFIVRPSVPQLEILQRAKLFISHGGTNSVNESLYYSIPLLMIPLIGDQFWAARRAEMLGVGKRLKLRLVNAKRLMQMANELIENSAYAQRSHMIGASLRLAGGHLHAVDEIEKFKQAKGML